MPEKKKECKVCSVCGDAALGYNFNAITCESCKAFFRRNAMKDKMFRCPFKGNCELTSLTRRFCQSCRLYKCFSVGMKRELIMTEEDKERKRLKRAVNGDRIIGGKNRLISAKENSLKEDIALQTDIPCFNCVSPSSTFLSLTCTEGSQTEVTPLSPSDKVLLNDLLNAMKALDGPVDQDETYLPGYHVKYFGSQNILDVINLTAIAIRRLIKMCKRISGFKALPQSDQLTLLKQGCTQMMLIRSVFNFDPERDSWKIPHSADRLARIKLEVLKEVHCDLYDAHGTWLRSFDSRVSSDLRVISLMIAIVLFEPSRSNLISSPFIHLVQERYCEVLHRYLDSLYLLEDARHLNSHLLDQIGKLKRLNEDHIRVFLNVDPSQVEPLLIEIFDIK